MGQKKIFLILLAILAVIGFTVNLSIAKEPYVVQYENETVLLLESGSPMSCPDDFMVWNKGNQATEIEVLLGDDTFLSEVIDPKEKRFYSRSKSILSAQLQGKDIMSDEDVIVINPQQKTNIRLHCLE